MQNHPVCIPCMQRVNKTYLLLFIQKAAELKRGQEWYLLVTSIETQTNSSPSKLP